MGQGRIPVGGYKYFWLGFQECQAGNAPPYEWLPFGSPRQMSNGCPFTRVAASEKHGMPQKLTLKLIYIK